MPPRVSVVMTVYNGERYLAEAIASVLGQTYADFELIIVDDGSTDGSRGIIEAYARRDPRIRLLPLADNQGMASARNRGIERARGQFIAFSDCDDICLPDRLRRQVKHLESNPDIGVLGCTMWAVDHKLRPLAENTAPLEHALIAWGLHFNPILPGGSSMIRSELLVDNGGYEEGRLYADDLELWSRLIEKTRFASLPDILMLYRRHPQAAGIGSRKRQQAEGLAVRKRMLERLWGEAPEETVNRFVRVPRRETDFSHPERMLLRADLTRLADAIVRAGWVQEDERTLLATAIDGALQRTMSRRQRWRDYLLNPRKHHVVIETKLRQILRLT